MTAGVAAAIDRCSDHGYHQPGHRSYCDAQRTVTVYLHLDRNVQLLSVDLASRLSDVLSHRWSAVHGGSSLATSTGLTMSTPTSRPLLPRPSRLPFPQLPEQQPDAADSRYRPVRPPRFKLSSTGYPDVVVQVTLQIVKPTQVASDGDSGFWLDDIYERLRHPWLH